MARRIGALRRPGGQDPHQGSNARSQDLFQSNTKELTQVSSEEFKGNYIFALAFHLFSEIQGAHSLFQYEDLKQSYSKSNAHVQWGHVNLTCKYRSTVFLRTLQVHSLLISLQEVIYPPSLQAGSCPSVSI